MATPFERSSSKCSTAYGVGYRYECPTNFNLHNNVYCYNLDDQGTTDWNTARSACNSLGGYLVKIDDPTESDYLINGKKKVSNNNVNFKIISFKFVEFIIHYTKELTILHQN